MFSCFFVKPDNLWIPHIVLCLVGCWVSLYSYKYFCGCSGMQLSNLQFDPFGSCFYDLFRRSRAVLSLRLIILHYWDKTFLRTLNNAKWIICFSSLTGENQALTALSMHQALFLNTFRFFSPPLLVVTSCMNALINILLNTWDGCGAGESWQILGVLSLGSSLLFITLASLVSKDSQLHSLNSESALGSTGYLHLPPHTRPPSPQSWPANIL